MCVSGCVCVYVCVCIYVCVCMCVCVCVLPESGEYRDRERCVGMAVCGFRLSAWIQMNVNWSCVRVFSLSLVNTVAMNVVSVWLFAVLD